MSAKIIIVTGPTASGKSGIALSLAQKKGGVIINADSQQVYRNLRVLTARPTPEEEALVPHRLYGTLEADESCSAGKWLKYVQMEIDWALSQGLLPIVTGGTGLYIKALLEGIAEVPDIDPSVRVQAANDFDVMGKDAFAERLKAVDPEFFTRLAVYDRQRLLRAYEVWLGTGKSLSWWQQKGSTPPYRRQNIAIYRVDIDRELLYQRCNQRFDVMLEQGAVEEAKQLLLLNIPDTMPIMKSVGVKELRAYIMGAMTLVQATDLAKQFTRNYAKRQLTWLRNQLPDAVPISSASEP